MTGRGVPFHGAAEPGVEIGLAAGQQAELDRASGLESLRGRTGSRVDTRLGRSGMHESRLAGRDPRLQYMRSHKVSPADLAETRSRRTQEHVLPTDAPVIIGMITKGRS